MAKVRGGGNSTLLNLEYKDPSVIKSLLRGWSGIETLSLKGDRVATCVIADLKRVTGIDLSLFDKNELNKFIEKRNKDVLTEAQFIAISFVLVLGYSQPEVAFIFGVSQQAVGKNIVSGAKRISNVLTKGGDSDE